ncbi:hypothetical protein AB4114_33675 [Paenibacillus sp. 2RAB27]|uniref:hypothetical protein n=1 Tax=Paenibacillus sp. 2RAB27 TaxID=3232991 RepID=UPI003F9B37C4
MRKIIMVTISIVLILTFSFYAVNSLTISVNNGPRVVASGTGSRSNTLDTSYSPLPGNSVKENKHVTSYKNKGTVLMY